MFFVDASTNRVGIGTTSPVDKFHVNSGRVEFTATTDASGNAGSGVLEIGKSLRIDPNEIITNTSTTVYLQNDYNGDLRVDPFGNKKLGLIAQETLTIIPEALKTHDNKILNEDTKQYQRIELKRMGMTYQQLIPVLIKATQEQQAEIEMLKEEINVLKQLNK
jgi:hypothetical protein